MNDRDRPGNGAREGEASTSGEAIAIVGMACRFPGADGISAFWRLLEAGENAVLEGLPGSGVGRVGAMFPDDTGQIDACRFGAYLDNLDRFDAAFFRISPVEAQLLDPQQRLILETSWRALEDAGIDPDRLKDSRTGVYAGISNNDYRGLILEASENAGPAEPAASLYAVTGTSLNTAIGRVAFALGLGGPAMAVDTACSSSLVATHQAVTGLQRGDADLALAGGVNIILSGRLLEFRANAGMLSPDGQCKTFDASANGYVRGEGCGIVVLKRLADAEADGDRIWGTIRGSALNQDGASAGLTVPNGAAQERVIRAALQRAGVQASDIDYLEAHGTGTEVGDPIEIDATAAVYGAGRDMDRPLLIGSVKTNIGHLESAAGVAGLIKTVLAINRGVIPRHLHFHNPNPEMDWERLPLRVTSSPTPWPARDSRPRLAGVSGFGWSGTNAHVVLEGYTSPDGAAPRLDGERWIAGASRPVPVSLPVPVAPARSKDGLAPRATRLLPLSAKTGAALRDVAEGYLQWLDREEAPSDSLLSDMAWSAGTGRSHFGHRAGVVFRDDDSLREGLRALAGTDEETASRNAGTVAFAYTGQASQWPGMGAALYDSEPVVRAVLDRCDDVLGEERGASLLDVMFGRPGAAGDLDDPQWKQPAIYALECALTALWSSLGIQPDVVLGHSLGEIAAAHTAGAFDLEDGVRLAAARGALIGALPGEGAMAAVFAPAARVAEALDAHKRGLAGHRPLHRRRQRRPPGHQRSRAGDRLDPRTPGSSRHSGGAAAQEPGLSQRHDRAGDGRSGGRSLAAPPRTAVAPVRQQSRRPTGRPRRGAGCGVLAAADARAGGIPRLRRDPGGARGGRGRGDRPPRGARTGDLDGLAEYGQGRGPGGGVEPEAAGDRRGPSGAGVGRRFRGGGRGSLRGRIAAALRRAFRRRGAPPHRAAGLSVPARALLGRGTQAAEIGHRPPLAGARVMNRRAARSPSTPRSSLPTRHGSTTTGSSAG